MRSGTGQREGKARGEQDPLPWETSSFGGLAILPPSFQKELPPFYSPWMEIAHKLPYLTESHQLRSHVNKMPLLSSQYLQGHRELYLAHLVLSCITMGYVWQEGEKGTAKILPRNLAIPFGEISQALGLPPILVHMDLVLANWKKRNPYGVKTEWARKEKRPFTQGMPA
uniref:Indoleamine 2,3-dioxygenase 2 n=1 Tax=Salvator merianae TaxID=96440 RepID=A0A8D0E231_SALMN